MATTSYVDFYEDLFTLQNELIDDTGHVNITAKYLWDEKIEELKPLKDQILAAIDRRNDILAEQLEELEILKEEYDAAILPADKNAALAAVQEKEKEISRTKIKIQRLEDHDVLKRYQYLLDHPKSLLIHEVDLSNRIIYGPDTFGVENDKYNQDHFFAFDRYFDYEDLTTKVCVFFYKNVQGQRFYIPIKEYDVTTLKDEDKIIVKVCFPYSMFVEPGTVQYCFCFYEIGEDLKFKYKTSTQIAEAEIKAGIEQKGFYHLEYDEESINNALNALSTIEKEYQLNWEIL